MDADVIIPSIKTPEWLLSQPEEAKALPMDEPLQLRFADRLRTIPRLPADDGQLLQGVKPSVPLSSRMLARLRVS